MEQPSQTLTRNSGFPNILRRINSKDSPVVLQFFKYGLCGIAAVAVHNLVFAALSYAVLPAVDPELGDSVRAVRATLNNCVAFVFSNAVAYFSNAKWVFVQGRHRPLHEFLFFTLISGISFAAALTLVPVLIRGLSLSTWIAQAAFVVSSALVNYLCRKFLVFQR